GKNWKDWDFSGATANPVWKSGLNGVGYDNTLATSYYPWINIYMRSDGTMPAGTTPVPPVIYGPPDMFSNSPILNYGCFIRLPFTLTAADISGLTGFRIYGHVDDGFVAWLNGVKI